MRCTDGGTFVSDLSAYSEPGTVLTAGWVAVPDPLATSTSTRRQLPEVTRSRKFEGAWWGRNTAYIACSYARGNSDGSVGQHDGQVWRLDPRRETLTLEVHFGLNPDPSSDLPDGPDNITVSPWGGLFLAEDGEGVQHLQAVTRFGETVPFARNARDDGEFAGVVLLHRSPDALCQPAATGRHVRHHRAVLAERCSADRTRRQPGARVRAGRRIGRPQPMKKRRIDWSPRPIGSAPQGLGTN